MIELLIVIAIIAILAATLFPAFIRAKKSAKSTVCLSNLHQIGSALAMYMGDNDDLYPWAIDYSDRIHPEQWVSIPSFEAQIPNMPLMQTVLDPYVKGKEAFHCPSDAGTQILDDHFPLSFEASPSDFSTFGSSYLYRTELTQKLKSGTTISEPTQINVYFDAAGYWHGDTAEADPSDTLKTFLEKTHGYRYNTLFADNHVKSLSQGALQDYWSTAL